MGPGFRPFGAGSLMAADMCVCGNGFMALGRAESPIMMEISLIIVIVGFGFKSAALYSVALASGQ